MSFVSRRASRRQSLGPVHELRSCCTALAADARLPRAAACRAAAARMVRASWRASPRRQRTEPRRARQSVTLHTTLGDLKVEVYCEEVPRSAENFLALCASGYYDGTKFHRRDGERSVCTCVRGGRNAGCMRRRNIKGFMVQGGDPTGACADMLAQRASCGAEALRCAGTGRGGTSIWGGKFPDELRDTLKARAAQLPSFGEQR